MGDEPATLRLVDQEQIGEGLFFTVHRRRYATPDGTVVLRDIVEHPGAVAVIPIIDDDVLLFRQYRVAAEADMLEIPAGKRDAHDEDPVVTAHRECVEEIGYRPGHLELLHEFYSAPGFTTEYLWLYEATDLTQVETRPQGIEEEAGEIVRMPIEDALHLARRGDIVDAKTLIGLYAAAAKRRRE